MCSGDEYYIACVMALLTATCVTMRVVEMLEVYANIRGFASHFGR